MFVNTQHIKFTRL